MQLSDGPDRGLRSSMERIAQANMSAFLRFAGDRKHFARALPMVGDASRRVLAEMWKFADVIASDTGETSPWDEVVRGLDRMAPPDPELGPAGFSAPD